jgi:hypothetical protein
LIYRFDHVGITVRSLAEAQRQLGGLYPCVHAQHDIEARAALRDVSLHRPERLSLSLHRRPGEIEIELMEYPHVSAKAGSILPWCYTPEESPDGVEELKRAARAHVDRSVSADAFGEIGSRLATQRAFNAVVIAVDDLSAEECFWRRLRFTTIHADDELVILSLTSLLPPRDARFIVLLRVGYATGYHTDLEGINELAFLCGSCAGDLRTFPPSTFRSSVDTFVVNGQSIDLGYLRSPSGVLAELFSVRFAALER